MRGGKDIGSSGLCSRAVASDQGSVARGQRNPDLELGIGFTGTGH